MRTIQLDQSLFDLSGIFLAAGKGPYLELQDSLNAPEMIGMSGKPLGSYSPKGVAVCPV